MKTVYGSLFLHLFNRIYTLLSEPGFHLEMCLQEEVIAFESFGFCENNMLCIMGTDSLGLLIYDAIDPVHMLNRASVNRDCSPIMSTLGTLCKDG